MQERGNIMRLQKYMARCGLASRRKSEELILDGLVEVNNQVVTKLGTTVNPDKDLVKVKNKVIRMEANKVYIMLNKPVGYVTTMDDEKKRRIVTDLIEGINERIYPVGRLDIDSSGLLLLTNDGEITFKLTHPSNRVLKRYIVVVEGVPNKQELNQFRQGLYIDGRKTSRAHVRVLRVYENESILEISIHEGRNRQVKKMCALINHPVKKLKRIAIGEIEMGNLQLGNWRYLNKEEIAYLNTI